MPALKAGDLGLNPGAGKNSSLKLIHMTYKMVIMKTTFLLIFVKKTFMYHFSFEVFTHIKCAVASQLQNTSVDSYKGGKSAESTTSVTLNLTSY